MILQHAVAFGVHQPEAELRGSIALIGGEAKPFDGFGVIAQPAATAVVDQPDERLGADITLFGERPRKPQRGCLIAIPKGRLGGAGIVHRGWKGRCCHSISDGFREPIAVGAEREPERQNDGGAGGGQHVRAGGRTSCYRLPGKRRLQHAHLFLQGRDMRPTRSESMPPSHALSVLQNRSSWAIMVPLRSILLAGAPDVDACVSGATGRSVRAADRPKPTTANPIANMTLGTAPALSAREKAGRSCDESASAVMTRLLVASLRRPTAGRRNRGLRGSLGCSQCGLRALELSFTSVILVHNHPIPS